MLKIQNLSKNFADNQAVKDISFDIKAGEIFSLIGPNGSGKTTIIKIIAGLLYPDAGSVTVDENDIRNNSLHTKSVIGYIPDEPTVWPAMTGEEFLHFSGALFNVTEKERLNRIHELLELFELKGIEKKYFEDYSRGNKQKFTILAALLHQPKLLLIDEPIVGLDPTSAEMAKKQFSAFRHNGGAILLATHTLSVAQEISTHIGLLKNGSLAASGTMDELALQARLDSGTTLDDIYLTLTKTR